MGKPNKGNNKRKGKSKNINHKKLKVKPKSVNISSQNRIGIFETCFIKSEPLDHYENNATQDINCDYLTPLEPNLKIKSENVIIDNSKTNVILEYQNEIKLEVNNENQVSLTKDNSEINEFPSVNSENHFKTELDIKTENMFSESIECMPDIIETLDTETNNVKTLKNYPNKLYIEHINKNRASTSYLTCKNCNFYCKSLSILEEHLKENLNGNNKIRNLKECNICKFKSIWTPVFERHVCKRVNKRKNNITIPIFRTVCYICNKHFSDLNCCKCHILNVHKTNTINTENVIENRIEYLYQCKNCFKILETEILLKKHLCLKSNVKCETCNLIYCNENALIIHKQEKHLGKRNTSKNIDSKFNLMKKEVLNIQPRTSKVIPKSKVVERVASNVKFPLNLISYFCPKCGIKFSDSKELKKHLLDQLSH